MIPSSQIPDVIGLAADLRQCAAPAPHKESGCRAVDPRERYPHGLFGNRKGMVAGPSSSIASRCSKILAPEDMYPYEYDA